LLSAMIAIALRPTAADARSAAHCHSNPVPFSDTILQAVLSATNSLFLETWNFDSLSLAQALIGAHEKGLTVEIIITQASEATPLPKLLRANKVTVLVVEELPRRMVLIADGECFPRRVGCSTAVPKNNEKRR
jgi:hypothetical protein